MKLLNNEKNKKQNNGNNTDGIYCPYCAYKRPHNLQNNFLISNIEHIYLKIKKKNQQTHNFKWMFHRK